MKPHFEKIMVATDFSDASKDAFEHAVWLSQLMDAQLRILHVFDPGVWDLPSPYYFLTEYDSWVDEHIDNTREKGKEALYALMNSVSGKVDSCFAEGKPVEMIVYEAKEWGADLLVLGSHGYTGSNRILMGSVADKVMRQAHCAVLTIKPRPFSSGERKEIEHES